MYEVPPNEPHDDPVFVRCAVRMVAATAMVLWSLFILYVGLGGNLVTMLLGLPNERKFVITPLVWLAGLILIELPLRLRRR
jgi:hypothetical protein